MLSKDELQKTITAAAESGLSAAVSHDAFEYSEEGWRPRSRCLMAEYSSSESILCSTLLCFHFELNGRCPNLVIPPGRKGYTNSVTDIIWPGAWYIYSAACRLSDKTSWNAIKMLFP